MQQQSEQTQLESPLLSCLAAVLLLIAAVELSAGGEDGPGKRGHCGQGQDTVGAAVCGD